MPLHQMHPLGTLAFPNHETPFLQIYWLEFQTEVLGITLSSVMGMGKKFLVHRARVLASFSLPWAVSCRKIR